MQDYLCVVKGQGIEFKLQKENQEQVEKYQKAFARDFAGSYEEMFHDHRSGGLLDGIYANPLESFIEVYKGLDVDSKPLFTINIKEISDSVNGEVINRGFVGLIESSRGTVGDFLINLPEDELFDPTSLRVHISTVKTSNNGDINFATGFSYKGFEGPSDEFDFEKGKDADLTLNFDFFELDLKNQDFVYNFNNKPQLLTQQQLNKAAVKYYQQWESKEKNLFNLFKKDAITVEAVSKAASYFSIARNFSGSHISRWQNIIDALNLIQPGDMNPFTKVHEHLVKTMGVKNVPSATSKFIFLRKRNHSLPIYDSVVKKSLGLKANCNYSEFQAAFNLVFIEYQKELKIACNKLDIEIAKQAWFQMRVLDLALWQLGAQK
jgi:hypothetical protein